MSALLFHSFFGSSESPENSRDRLRRQLDWLSKHYVPLTLAQFTAAAVSGNVPDRSVLVTADDANIDLLSVADVFDEFGISVAVFVCAGWTALASDFSDEDMLARAAAAIQWYEGPETEVAFGANGRIGLVADLVSENIDLILTNYADCPAELDELVKKILILDGRDRGKTCSWAQLFQLADAGMAMGVHSVTHVDIAAATRGRQSFEVFESKRLCDTFLGPCNAFAYPYGMTWTANEATESLVRDAGFEAAFLTNSGFITCADDPLRLPRITIPDEPLPLAEFRARASGVGIAARNIRSLLPTF